MKYIKKFEQNKRMTVLSLDMLNNIFKTTDIPYDVIVSSSMSPQKVTIKDVDVEIIKKLLGVYKIFCFQVDILEKYDNIDIIYYTGSLYKNKEISLQKRNSDGDLIFSLPVAKYINGECEIIYDEYYASASDTTSKLNKDDLDKIRIQKNSKKYNL